MDLQRVGRIGMVLAALAIVALVGACGSSSVTSTAPADLTGDWTLASYRNADGDVVDADEAINSQLTMEDGNSNGVGAINTFTGSYEAGDDGSIEFGPQATTLMAGGDAAMAQESGFFAALADASTFAITDGSLTLSDVEGDTVAVLESMATATE